MSEESRRLAIVLVRPQLGENIGAAARVMLNFELDDLRLVEPRDGWPNPSAVKMASGAGRVLDRAQISPDLNAALGNVHYAYATTARKRDLSKPVLNPSDAMAEAAQRCCRGQRVAVVFGAERAGLENDDLVLANAIIELPVNDKFKSVNLAQCVALICYEAQRSFAATKSQDSIEHELASVNEKTRFVELLVEDLSLAGYFWPPEKAAGMKLNLTNLFMRLDLSKPEIKTLHGVRRALLGSFLERSRNESISL